MIFSNRELATAFWLLAALAWIMSKRKLRISTFGLAKLLFGKQILSLIILAAVYTAGAVFLLIHLGFWKLFLLKDTIFWFCFTGLALGYRYVTSEKNERIFSRILFDSVRIAVFLEFLVNIHSFSLPLELALIPFVSLVVILNAVANLKPEHASVAKVTSGVMIAVGFGILAFALVQTISSYQKLLAVDVFLKILLPPILSVLFSPFVYFLVLAISYEQIFSRINFNFKDEKPLRKYAKSQMFFRCGISLSRVQFILNKRIPDLFRARTREDIDKILKSPNRQDK